FLRLRLGDGGAAGGLGGLPLVAEEDSGALRAEGAHALRQATLEATRLAWPDALEDQMLEAIDRGGAQPPADGSAFWTLDPIDGTKGFLRGQQYAVSLGLIQNGRPVLGVMACPNLPADPSAPLDVADPHGALYFAVLGEGA